MISFIGGGKADAQFYSDTQPWVVDNQQVLLQENNDHLGLIVGNNLEEQKNVDNKLRKCRGTLFQLLILVRLHVWV